MSERGDGYVFLRGRIWWCSFYVDGVEHKESTKTTDKKLGEKYLARRVKVKHAHEVTGEQFVTQRDRRRTVAELLEEVKVRWQLQGKGSQKNLSLIKMASAAFGHFRALSLTDDAGNRVVRELLMKGYANATLNRWITTVKQSYHLAKLKPPNIVRLDETGNVRKGFFEAADFDATKAGLLDVDLQDFVEYAYWTGWRRGEISTLSWSDVESESIELRAEHAKIRRARSVPLEGKWAEIIDRRKAKRQYTTTDGITHLSEFVFHRQGERIKEFRKSWATACVRAGVGAFVCPKCKGNVDEESHCAVCVRNWKREDLRYRGYIFYDLRRTAVRDMDRAGVPQAVVMSITGHRTPSIYLRYNISDDRDRRKALRSTELYRQQQREAGITRMRRNG